MTIQIVRSTNGGRPGSANINNAMESRLLSEFLAVRLAIHHVHTPSPTAASTSSQLTTNLTTLWTYYVLVISSILLSRLGVKATTLKAKNFASKAKAKAKDLAFKAKDDIKANVTMVRCSVKTSKHRRLLQGW